MIAFSEIFIPEEFPLTREALHALEHFLVTASLSMNDSKSLYALTKGGLAIDDYCTWLKAILNKRDQDWIYDPFIRTPLVNCFNYLLFLQLKYIHALHQSLNQSGPVSVSLSYAEMARKEELKSKAHERIKNVNACALKLRDLLDAAYPKDPCSIFEYDLDVVFLQLSAWIELDSVVFERPMLETVVFDVNRKRQYDYAVELINHSYIFSGVKWIALMNDFFESQTPISELEFKKFQYCSILQTLASMQYHYVSQNNENDENLNGHYSLFLENFNKSPLDHFIPMLQWFFYFLTSPIEIRASAWSNMPKEIKDRIEDCKSYYPPLVVNVPDKKPFQKYMKRENNLIDLKVFNESQEKKVLPSIFPSVQMTGVDNHSNTNTSAPAVSQAVLHVGDNHYYMNGQAPRPEPVSTANETKENIDVSKNESNKVTKKHENKNFFSSLFHNGENFNKPKSPRGKNGARPGFSS